MITDETISKAKQADLPALFRNANIDLIPTNNGSSFKCLCPFHEDKDPSLNLNHKDGLWLFNCFGCGTGGTTIDFIMKRNNIDFKEAVLKLVPDFESKNKIDSSEIAPLQNDKKSRIELLSMVVEHYHKILTSEDTKGRSYLEKRGLLDEEIIKTFKLGYSNNDANEALKDCRLQLREELGIFKDNYYETFANCVIFPVLDLEGFPTDIYARRTMNYTDRANHCYNKGKHQGIFNISNVINSESIILTEGIIDALSIYKAGFKNVTALYGTQGFTKAHEELFNNGTVKEIIFALDNDGAGIKAVQKLSERLKNLKIKQAVLPEDKKDFNELLVSQGLEAVKKAVENAGESTFTAIQPFNGLKSGPEISSGLDTSFKYEGFDLIYKSDFISYRVRNAGSLKSLNSLRFVITASKFDNADLNQFYTDRIDLYLSRSRKAFEVALFKVFDV